MMLTKFSVIVMSWTEWQVVQLGTCDKRKLEAVGRTDDFYVQYMSI